MILARWPTRGGGRLGGVSPYPYSYPLILCRDTNDLGEEAGTEDILSQKCLVQLSAVAR